MTIDSSEINTGSIIGGDFQSWVSQHREQRHEWFDLYRKIDGLCHRVRRQLQCVREDEQRFFVDSLFHRSLSIFEGAFVLAESGLIAESRILSRSLLELRFAFVAALKDKTFVKRYVAYQDRRETILRKQSLPHLKESIAAELAAKIETQIEQLRRPAKSAEKLTPKETAGQAVLTDVYETDYRALCRSTHIGLHDLDQYLVLNEHSRVVGFQWGPSDEGFVFSVFQPMNTMLSILSALCEFHSIDETDAWKGLAGELTALESAARDVVPT